MIGIDAVLVSRIKDAVESAAFRDRVFTECERGYCESRPRPFESYAGIFCAKEAAVKAAKCGFTGGVVPRDIEVTHDLKGAPLLAFYGKAAEVFSGFRADVSITHDGGMAIAIVKLSDKRGDK